MASTINATPTSSGLIQTADNSGVLALQTGGTTGLTVNAVQGVQALNCIGVGNATPSTSGAGITFPATQSASTDANTLDDYEEGTWTPTLVFSGGAGTLSYATRTGYYTKIGRVVYISMNLIFSKGTASGTMDNISGLPFSSGEAFGSGALIDNMSALVGSPVWITQGSLAYIYMTNTGALGSINATSMGASSNVFRFAGYYNI